MFSTIRGFFGGGVAKSDPALEALIEESLVDLRAKTMGHQNIWRLGEEGNWAFEQDSGELVFTLDDGSVACASAQIVGTWDSCSTTWLWAWGNPSISESLTKDALIVREYGSRSGIEKLTTQRWKCTESEAWEMAGVATKIADAQGAYRGPAGETYVFFTFGEVRLSKK